jgi:hypothetical protein
MVTDAMGIAQFAICVSTSVIPPSALDRAFVYIGIRRMTSILELKDPIAKVSVFENSLR